MTANPETLKTYAEIFDMPRRFEKGGELHPPSEPSRAAADALRFQAAMIEMYLSGSAAGCVDRAGQMILQSGAVSR